MSEVDNTTEINSSKATKKVLNLCEHCLYFLSYLYKNILTK